MTVHNLATMQTGTPSVRRAFGWIGALFVSVWLLGAAPGLAQVADEDVNAQASATSVQGTLAGESLSGTDAEPRYETATIVSITPLSASEREVVVAVTSGEDKGREVKILQAMTGQENMDLSIRNGDGVIIAALPSEDGATTEYQLADFQRRQPLLVLAVVSGIAMVAIGGLRGIKTMAILGLTATGIVGGLIPLTLSGWQPLVVSVLIASLIALVTTLLTSGWERKSLAATLGTLASVVTTALVAHLVVTGAHLSGIAADDLNGALGKVVNFPGLLAASMMIGSLGMVLDLALSISAAVCEVAESNPEASRATLFQTGWQVGQDLLSTAGNTLLMAYMGCFLPVLLALAAQHTSLTRAIHMETIVNEASAVLIGLLGLLVVIPYTAFIVVMLQPGISRNRRLYRQ